jgi:hypothetical protein
MKNLKILILIFALSLQGCYFYECIDTQIPRWTSKIDEVYHVEVVCNGKMYEKQIQCEKYYDSMCAERGNYWTYREVGFDSEYQKSTIMIRDEELGEIEIPVPSCKNMVEGRKTPLKHLLLKINGETYWLMSSDGELRTYQSDAHSKHPNNTVYIKLMMNVNGVELE